MLLQNKYHYRYRFDDINTVYSDYRRGVCTYTHFEWEYKLVNQSYRCCKQYVKPQCRGTRFRRWADFGQYCACSFQPADPCVYLR